MKNRTFTLEDQVDFARLSGDHNPLHIDPHTARRTLFGAPVVHGIHSVLWGLDSWLEDNPSYMTVLSIKAVFPRPIRVGDTVILTYENDDKGLRIELNTAGAMATVINMKWEASVNNEPSYITDRFPEKREPQELSKEEIDGRAGTMDLCLNMKAVTKMFPHIARYVSPNQIAAILCTTRLVGIECPGKHSVYSEFNLASGTFPGQKGMQYRVTKFDRRFDLAYLKVITPGMSGVIKAFIRPQQHDQVAYNIVNKLVKREEFAGQRALIVGGSRGLGEVVAKLLAAGSAEVKITYHQGEMDARRVANEINVNRGIADILTFNVLHPDRQILNAALSSWKPTHLYYFATPFIFVGAKGIFSPDLFSKFCDYYVKGFLNTVNYLRDLGLKNVYSPSTIAIDELPLDMGEYAAAKIAAETLCSFLEKSNKDMTIFRPRLPRMSTDQTVSLLPVKNNDPVPVMLKHLRHFRDAAACK